jgi:hypothetical protein
VRLAVTDEGRGGTADPGFGLLGMRERVGLLHGELTAGPGPRGGFHVGARIPVPSGERRRSRVLAEPSTPNASAGERGRSRVLAEPSTPNASAGVR